METQTEIKVNFVTNTITVIKTETFDLFTDKGLYVIEGDSYGFSRIETGVGTYHMRNYRKEPGKKPELYSTRFMNQQQVRDTIKENEKFKREPKTY